METYLHSFYTWALARHGARHGRAAGVAGALGALLPDVPAILGTVYYVGPAFLADGWSAMDSEGVIEAIYFTAPFGAAGRALHSALPPLVLLALYALLRGARRLDGRRVGLWFLLGWLGHAGVDFLTHAENVRPLFWPLSGWTWSSPVSYYDPEHYGREFFRASHGLALLLMLALLGRRVIRLNDEKRQV
ncbi:LexA-binding, inner membrane-associated putative hydrolase [Rubrobacter radiotolerans DSM 5868]|nr:LexA-binding, inner membrane-associated putative hydrolase [Rubrobacter radiotolerans DSM 5868]